VLFKLDIEKAYDHAIWNFLLYMLRRYNFRDKLRNWIAHCISLVFFSIFLNDAPKGFFSSFWGWGYVVRHRYGGF